MASLAFGMCWAQGWSYVVSVWGMVEDGELLGSWVFLDSWLGVLSVLKMPLMCIDQRKILN